MYKFSDLVHDLKMLMYAQSPLYTQNAQFNDDTQTGNYFIKTVCKALEVKEADVVSPNRKQELSDARHIICFALRKHTTLTARQIGKMLGDRNHSTVLSSAITCQEFIDNDDSKIIRKIALINNHLPEYLCI